jgi:hypothetical protein
MTPAGPRPAWDYRGAYRNQMRESTGTIRAWEDTEAWRRANVKARWMDRRAWCEKAREIATKVLVETLTLRSLGVPVHKAVDMALLQFWHAATDPKLVATGAYGIRRGRALSRVIRGLEKAVA